ncbi:MAG: GNAT family N-acetyltransferase [Phycisphaerae bacterium]|nr:GNAT family N-acetyltransferase [Phycisphaerae bacterium]
MGTENQKRGTRPVPTVRSLGISDAGKLLAFYEALSDSVARLFRPFGTVDERVITEHLHETECGRHISLGLVYGDGTIKGHGLVRFLDRDKPSFGIGLCEGIQGRGWGRKLMEAVLDEADARGLSLITLTVLKENSRAIALYEKTGFEVKGEAKAKKEGDSYYMERRPRGLRES